MKYRHIITINQLNKSFQEYQYNFGRTKDIKIRICAKGCQIIASLDKYYQKEKVLSGNAYLFPDAIRKALLVYLLSFSKGLDIKKVTVSIDDDEESFKVGKNSETPVYSMINGDLARNLPTNFSSNPVIDFVLRTTKSNYGRLTAALFAFLTSKSKSYEMERFIYLWTCFNAIYGYFATLIKAQRGNEIRNNRITEADQIKYFLRMFNFGNEHIPQTQNSIIAKEIISYLSNYNGNISREIFQQDELAEEIERIIVNDNGNRYDITAYGYLLARFAYYFRCKYIHGSKPVILFAYADDADLHCLKIVNELLEEFIDENLPMIFDNEYLNNIIIPRINNISLQ